MEKKVYLQQVDFTELESVIRNAVKEGLKNFTTLSEKENVENQPLLLGRKETAQFLQICLTTLWDLDRKGILPSRRIKSKVYYLKSDLINFLNQAA